MNGDCPFCGGEIERLGIMGDCDWYRCVDCGEEFAFPVEEEDQEIGYVLSESGPGPNSDYFSPIQKLGLDKIK